jgi:hypothetical protein
MAEAGPAASHAAPKMGARMWWAENIFMGVILLLWAALNSVPVTTYKREQSYRFKRFYINRYG